MSEAPGWKRRLLEAAPVLAFLGLWEAVARSGLAPGSPKLFPPFSEVLLRLVALAADGILGPHYLASLLRVLAGFTLGSLLGIACGILLGWKPAVRRAFHPVVSLLYPIPALGWLPLLMLWVGIGEALPVTIIFLCCFFPVLYNTVTGIRNVPEETVRAARTLGASEVRILRTVVVPLALPNVFTGLRLEAGMAWRVVLAAEMVAIPTGLGALVMRAESLVRADVILACLIVLSVMCLLFESVFWRLEKRLTRAWR